MQALILLFLIAVIINAIGDISQGKSVWAAIAIIITLVAGMKIIENQE